MQTKSQEDRSTHERQKHWTLFQEPVEVDLRRAAIGGGLAFVVTLGGAALVGEASGANYVFLLDTSLENVRRLCHTIIIATATILALMLTLLGISAGTDQDLRWEHYRRIRQIAWIDSVALIGAVLTYLLLNVPLEEANDIAGAFPVILYYTTLVVASLLGGALISIVLMLYNTVRDVIRVIGHKGAENLIASAEDE